MESIVKIYVRGNGVTIVRIEGMLCGDVQIRNHTIIIYCNVGTWEPFIRTVLIYITNLSKFQVESGCRIRRKKSTQQMIFHFEWRPAGIFNTFGMKENRNKLFFNLKGFRRGPIRQRYLAYVKEINFAAIVSQIKSQINRSFRPFS